LCSGHLVGYPPEADFHDDLAASSDHGEKHEGKHGGIHVFVVEFARVETPFIIALWIFCASLAKIGKHFHSTTKPKESRSYQ